MGDALKKVQQTQKLRIPAAAYNAFVDTARAHQQRQQDRQQTAQPASRSSGLVLVKNASGADRERFDVLGVNAPLFGPSDNLESFKNTLALTGITPTADHAGRFVILQEPLKADAIGLALAAGVSIVHINVQDQAHRLADVAEGTAGNLRSGSAGVAQILWKEAGTGVKWALVRLGAGGTVIPDGTQDNQVLKWDQDTQSVYWGTDEKGDTLPAGGSAYMVLQKSALGVVVWDYVRGI
jgi:hypothetical protein